jgi:hypothetical protein
MGNRRGKPRKLGRSFGFIERVSGLRLKRRLGLGLLSRLGLAHRLKSS